jgi:hypothetical protein
VLASRAVGEILPVSARTKLADRRREDPGVEIDTGVFT